MDLYGEWRNDAEIWLRNGIGELNVEAPRDVELDVRGGVSIGDRHVERPSGEVSPDAPRLTLQLSGTVGEMTVER